MWPVFPKRCEKYIIKSNETHRHYLKLKRQVDDLRRFNFYYLGICPKILLEKENDYLYFFDMEYLKNYKTLDQIENYENRLLDVSKLINQNIYCM